MEYDRSDAVSLPRLVTKRLLVVVSTSPITSCHVMKILKAAYGGLVQERKPASNPMSELGSGLSSTVESRSDLAQASSLVTLSQRHLSKLRSDS